MQPIRNLSALGAMVRDLVNVAGVDVLEDEMALRVRRKIDGEERVFRFEPGDLESTGAACDRLNAQAGGVFWEWANDYDPWAWERANGCDPWSWESDLIRMAGD